MTDWENKMPSDTTNKRALPSGTVHETPKRPPVEGGGLVSALETAILLIGEEANRTTRGPVQAIYDAESDLLREVADRLEAWRASWDGSNALADDAKADRALIMWLESHFVGEVSRRPNGSHWDRESIG